MILDPVKELVLRNRRRIRRRMPIAGFFARLQLQRKAVERAGSAGDVVGRFLQRSVEERLNLGDFDEIVRNLESLNVADDPSHFLRRRGDQSAYSADESDD